MKLNYTYQCPHCGQVLGYYNVTLDVCSSGLKTCSKELKGCGAKFYVEVCDDLYVRYKLFTLTEVNVKVLS